MNNNEPVILGHVKKGSAGKPMVVIIIFLFIGSFILFLPTIKSYFEGNNIIELLKNGQIIDFFINHDNYIDKPISNNNQKEETKEDVPVLINTKTIINGKNYSLNNFVLTTNSIKFSIITTEEINFDENNYYLVLTQNDKELTTIKIMDTTSTNKEQEFKFKNILENTLDIKGTIKTITESEYPDFKITSDESGLGSLICEKDNYKIEYILNNNNLIRVKETLNYLDNGKDYLNKFEEYTKLVTKLNNSNITSSITENYTGFIFTTDVDLSNYNSDYKNYNYYSLNTKTNIINFEMNAKGFDCK